MQNSSARSSFFVLAFLAILTLAAASILAGCASAAPASSSTSSEAASSAAASSATSAAASSETAASSSAPATAANADKLVIIHTNDVHGYVQADEGVLGLAAVAQLKQDYLDQGYDVLLLDAGDVLQGNLLANDTQGEKIVEFMNMAQYDAMALGNHEFDYGADVLLERIQACNFPVLCANITVDTTGELLTVPNTTFTLPSGRTVGVFGIDTPTTATESAPKNTAGLSIAAGEDLYACAQEQIDSLREQGADLVICLGHLGEDSNVTPNKGSDLVAHTTGIDVLINAHDHKVENENVSDKDGKNVLVAETGTGLANIGVLTFDGNTWTEELIAAGEYEGSDADLSAAIEAYAADVDKRMSEVVATTTVDLNGERSPGNRTQETNLGDLIADSFLWQATNAATKAPDAAIQNGGGVRTGVAAGDITMRNIHDIMPFGNQLCTIEVTGAQLLEAIEAGTQGLPEAMGGFPQVAGITYTVDTTVPYEAGEAYPDSTFAAPANPGSRVTISDVGGKGFALDATYVLAVADFVADGGDTYYAFTEARNTKESVGYEDYQALLNYVQDELGGTVPESYAQPQGRVNVIGADEGAGEELQQAA